MAGGRACAEGREDAAGGVDHERDARGGGRLLRPRGVQQERAVGRDGAGDGGRLAAHRHPGVNQGAEGRVDGGGKQGAVIVHDL